MSDKVVSNGAADSMSAAEDSTRTSAIHTGNTSESGDVDGESASVATTVSTSGKHAGEAPRSAASMIMQQHEQRGPHDHRPAFVHTTSATTRATLSSGTDGLVLFDLTTTKGAHVAFSPHCMKTILDLKLLDIGYDRQRLTFSEIRRSLAARVGDNVTVPTLEIADGSHLTDSFVISQFLAEKHVDGHRLFPTPSSRAYARMVEGFGKFALAPHLGPLTRPSVADRLDAESKAYFEEEKVGRAKMDKFRNMSADEREAHIDACAAALEPIQAALVVAKEYAAPPSASSPPPPASGRQTWLEAGDHPTHADFVLFGWYVYSRMAGPRATKAIWHAHPAVAQWVRAMSDWAGSEITGDFV